MNLAPVAVFTYRRPAHAGNAIRSLLANPEAAKSRIVVFSDGPKDEKDIRAVEETRAVLAGFHTPNLEIVTRERNAGLATSIIEGVTHLCREHGRAIVIEDDLVVAPTFMRFMNEALERYAEHEKAVQVSGFVYPVNTGDPSRCSFLPFTSSWGWATWARAWAALDSGPSVFARISSDDSLRRRFDLDGAYPYFEMLRAQCEGRVDSWAIRWYASTFLNNGLTLYPGRSLVYNYGFDGSGTHRGGVGQQVLASPSPVGEFTFPEVAVDEALLGRVRRFVARERSLVGRIRAKARALIGTSKGGT